MTKALTNYDKIKISTAHVFLQYNQATMIHKYSLDYNSDWLYITFINRTYRINRKTGSVQWSDNDFETVHEANHNEAMTIYDVLCYSKDRCHLSHEFVNINSLSSVRTGNLSPNRGFFQNTADFFNGKTVELRNACISLSGKELEKGDVAFVTSPFSCDILFQDMEKLRNQLDRKEENVHTEKVIHIFLSDEDSISFS